MIYHITRLKDWEIQKEKTEFTPSDYYREGFIHCCTFDQVKGVLERYFKGKTDLMLLHIEEAKLKAELKYEPSFNNEKFPHIYGMINKNAIVEISVLAS